MSKIIRLSNGDIKKIYATEKYVYYINANDNNYLYSIDVDGKNKKAIVKEEIKCFFAINNNIIYVSDALYCLNRISMDKIKVDDNSDILYICGNNDFFFCLYKNTYYSNQNFIQYYSYDGKFQKSLTQNKIFGKKFYIYDNFIFYQDTSANICRFNYKTEISEIVVRTYSSYSFDQFTLSDSKILYISDMVKINSVNFDGSKNKHIYTYTNSNQYGIYEVLANNKNIYFRIDDNIYITDYSGTKETILSKGTHSFGTMDMLTGDIFVNNRFICYLDNNHILYELQFNDIPVIDGHDRDLGDKNTGFNITYSVSDIDDDNLTVTEKLNGNILRTLSNAPKNQNIVLNITQHMFNTLSLNQKNTITIKVDDNKGGVVYRNYTFTRVNNNCIISDYDRDLGEKVEGFQIDYAVSDIDNDKIQIIERLNGNIIRTLSNVLSQKNLTINITNETLYTLPLNVENTIFIEASDGKGGVAYRKYTFKRVNNPPKIDIISNKFPRIIFKCSDIDKNDKVVEASISINNIIKKTFTYNLDKELDYLISREELEPRNNIVNISAIDSRGSETKVSFKLRTNDFFKMIGNKNDYMTFEQEGDRVFFRYYCNKKMLINVPFDISSLDYDKDTLHIWLQKEGIGFRHKFNIIKNK